MRPPFYWCGASSFFSCLQLPLVVVGVGFWDWGDGLVGRVDVRDHCYRTRFTFYGEVTYAEYVMRTYVPDRYAAVKWFIKDGSDDAFVSVYCNHRERGSWVVDHSLINEHVSAGSVSSFVTACREYVESYFYGTEMTDAARLAAMVIDGVVE